MLPILFAITLHEASHGYVAWRLGDDTAYRLGRVTFNPLKHVDPFGTVILPALLFMTGGFLFGWAKPVPVNFRRLNRPRRDMVLAAISALAFHLLPFASETLGSWLGATLVRSVYLNLILAVLNMLPLPPLDGGRVAVGLLPRTLALPLARLERWGLLILIGGLFILPWLGSMIGLNLNLFQWLIRTPIEWLWPIYSALSGGLI